MWPHSHHGSPRLCLIQAGQKAADLRQDEQDIAVPVLAERDLASRREGRGQGLGQGQGERQVLEIHSPDNRLLRQGSRHAHSRMAAHPGNRIPPAPLAVPSCRRAHSQVLVREVGRHSALADTAEIDRSQREHRGIVAPYPVRSGPGTDRPLVEAVGLQGRRTRIWMWMRASPRAIGRCQCTPFCS